MIRRRYVVGGLFVGLVILAGVMLARVLATVFLAVTVAYLLSPLHRRLHRRGLSRWGASALATAVAFLSTVALAVPFVLVAVLRLDEVVGLLRSLPDAVSVELLGLTGTVTTEQVLSMVIRLLRSLAGDAAAAAPVLLAKLALFGFLLFALLHHRTETRRAMLAVVPPSYRDVAEALHRRTRAVLFAIYVLQAATAAGTFLMAAPVFFLLGYPYPLTLATLAAILQFLPIIGPSLLILALAAYQVAVGNVVAAALLAVVGGFLVGWLPDLLIRPRLARHTADLPGSLYFVGFVGGLLTLGTVGIIAGPLVVALVVEAATLLSAEFNDIPVSGP